MSACPKCQNPVATDAIRCPHCNETLKAFGHPGIPLHRAARESSLCESCLYEQDDSCTFPQRPHAKTCTLYRDVSEPVKESEGKVRSGGKGLRDRDRALIMLIGLLGIAVFMALR